MKEAADKMKKEGIRSLVVVEDDEAVGIIVGRDVLYDVAAEGRDPGSVNVEEVMTSNLITASEADSIEDIARAMIRNDVSRIPVLQGENLVGMVAQSDLLRTWPSYVDLVQEESHAFAGESSTTPPVGEDQSSEGVCDSCENYSDDIKMV
ncbi:MAG: cyclic nucleotide-binding/CBS domain-containing protein, partial [Candidatus Aenigmatarchaeota archaeon]